MENVMKRTTIMIEPGVLYDLQQPICVAVARTIKGRLIILACSL